MVSNQCNMCFLFCIQLYIILAAFANSGTPYTMNPKPPYIRELKVPATIVNGSEADVVLDCDFRLDHNETTLLVVNWYANHSDLVYQWIFGRPPEAVGKFEHRVNLEYEASDVEFEKYRAVQIFNPTSDLSGEYSCKVSTKAGEAYATAKMTVYSPATEFDLRVTIGEGEGSNSDPDSDLGSEDSSSDEAGEEDQSESESGEDKNDKDVVHSDSNSNVLNITCWAYEVYPKPIVTLSYGDNDTDRQPLEDIKVEVTPTANGAFDTVVHKSIDLNSISQSTLFSCELKIEDTYYYLRRERYWHKEPNAGPHLRSGVGHIVMLSLLLLGRCIN